MEGNVIAIDLAKASFQVHVNDSRGNRKLGARLTRGKLKTFLASQPPSLVAMEACSGAHFWARIALQHGHQIKLIPPQYVRPFVKTNGNDATDAGAIAEAAVRPSIPCVPLKTTDQLDLQALHRVRVRLIRNRTALSNEIRGFLAELGFAIAKGFPSLKAALSEILRGEQSATVSACCRETMADLMSELSDIGERLKVLDERLDRISASDERFARLLTIPGVGRVSASAILARTPHISHFKHGRHYAAWLGLVPRNCGTGGKTRVLGISKRGDIYLRGLLIHGARSVMTRSTRQEPLHEWGRKLQGTKPKNVVAVAMANKIARICFCVLRDETEYEPRLPAQLVAAASH